MIQCDLPMVMIAEVLEVLPRMYLRWYLYIAVLTVIFALPIPYIGGGNLLNWKGWLFSGVYFTVVMIAVLTGTRAYCAATRAGWDILGCGIGILVTAFLLNTVMGAAIMWYTRSL